MTMTPSRWRAIAALFVVILAGLAAWYFPPNLGLDLRGGTQIVLEAESTERVEADAEATDRALEVIRGRVDALGVSEPTLARSGENRIIVELPGVEDPRKAAEVIGQTATLEFREVISPATAETQPEEGQVVLPDESGQQLLLAPPSLDGNGISDAQAAQPQNSIGSWVVNVDFNGEGRGPWSDLVSSACANAAGGQRIAIVLDQQVISSPQIQPDLCASGGGSTTSITGDFSSSEAADLAVLIKGGALPVPVEIIEQRTIGPTLGAAAIDASFEAALIGLALTGLFIVVIYRVVGFMATIALGIYTLIAYAILVWLGATLTLPGIAGFVLAIGLAIDANVLVFERAREEYQENPKSGLPPSLTTGFSKAWSAIIDSNITTILAAVLLFIFATGSVRGFGVTLTIGVIASMISALVVARVLAEWAVRRVPLRDHPRASGIAGTGRVRTFINERGPFIVKRAGLWVGVTAAVAIVSLVGVFGKGLNLGVDFTGGRIIEYSTAQQPDVDEIRSAVSDAGFPNAVVQESSGDGGDSNVTVRTEDLSDEEADQVRDAVASVSGDVEQIRDEQVGPSLGSELRTKALIAFAIALGAQMLYLAWRFRWTWALSAQLSLASVVLTVVGIFAWWGKTIDSVFLAAILAIIGLAVNDTIVVFDRIREHTGLRSGSSLRATVNEAILQTIPRTINTSLSALFILGALAVLGGDSLMDFSLAIIFGLVIGIFSTVFTASSLAVLLEERWPYDPDRDEKKQQVDPYAYVDNGRGDGAVL
ncbi:protein translocase subunit SecD [Aeromicrobium phragmitis]|uniref:Multifunctional fusion protein n=1 Tax=Aeromicrobium phragmitis TaxID=2478914 RepID=A0A3L8PJ80_9ACTN|nr:protein translocase subunit SecD [Aeromicrobium phragmitis]RLV55311.1 protein translocase subunit SecD [Aeromicrobium phragmitis]